MEGLLDGNELAFLTNYLGDTSLFGIAELGDFNVGMKSLLEKGILGSDLKPNDKITAIVEMLRLYQSSKQYVHVQEFVFALLPKGYCICKKTVETNDIEQHLFLIGNASLMFQAILGHPMIAYHASKLDGHSEEALVNCNLTLELFDKEGNFMEELSTQYEDGTWYWLDDDMNASKTMEEQNSVTWLLERLPSNYKEEYNKVRGEMMKA